MNRLDSDIFVVVLAGGSGTRFWPESRSKRPKQLCQIHGDLTMIETTLDRLDGFVAPDRRLIVTHQDQIEATKKIVGKRATHFLAEPKANNTGCALALASLAVRQITGTDSTIMISLHADAVVRDVDAFIGTLKKAAASARTGAITLIGVKPEYPETGYGYIEPGPPTPNMADTFFVKSFREKPDLQTAKAYLEKGYLWNTGMFTWQVQVIMQAFETFMPDVIRSLQPAFSSSGKLPDEKTLDPLYSRLKPMSIDEGVLEKASGISVVAAEIGWQDVGSWDAIDRLGEADAKGNLQMGESVLIDCQGTLVKTDGPLVAAIGLKDIVIVHVDGAILVCPKDRAQDVKHIVAKLKERGRSDLT